MSTYVVWFGAIVLEAVILIRGVRSPLLKRYSLFYAYLGCIFVTEFLRFSCYRLAPGLYPEIYWYSNLAQMVASYAILFDVFRHALRSDPGVSRIAQKLLLVVFVLAVTFIATALLHMEHPSWIRASAEFGRYLRNIEGVFLLLILWLLVRHRIPIARNLLGLFIGYSLLVGFDLMDVAFQVFSGKAGSPLFIKLHPVIYVVALITWCCSLWSLQPEATQPVESGIDRDYAILVAKTRTALGSLSARLARTLRP